METFKIEIQELLSREIDVQAKDIEGAILIVEKMYKEEEIVLDYSDLKKQSIESAKFYQEQLELIKEVIDYLYVDEKKNFEESDDTENHIFSKIERLKKLID